MKIIFFQNCSDSVYHKKCHTAPKSLFFSICLVYFKFARNVKWFFNHVLSMCNSHIKHPCVSLKNDVLVIQLIQKASGLTGQCYNKQSSRGQATCPRSIGITVKIQATVTTAWMYFCNIPCSVWYKQGLMMDSISTTEIRSAWTLLQTNDKV